ncbi:MAG: hypothetical protein II981_08535 [Bacteroidales bacterium]|nr:hypothetical protein [Bacteroidales bacterium]MBQ3595440.1 hypothetical protein [Bacteroidales bacterium]
MNDLNCIRIKYNIAFILFVLIIVAILGWCMLVLPSINIGDDIRYLVIAGVSFLLIEGVIRLVIFKILRIKSKDDFSQLPKFIVTEYINVNKNILSKILLIPNIVYCLLLVIPTIALQNEIKLIFYWTFTLSVCLFVFNILRVLKIESVKD